MKLSIVALVVIHVLTQGKTMRVIKKAMLKKAYGVGMQGGDFVCYKTSAYWPVGTVVEVVCRGKGNSTIVRLPHNEYDPTFTTGWRGKLSDLKFIKEKK
jgi:hypothetical protein